jgi:hypothetical protein
VKPETALYLEKSRDLLGRAATMMAAGLTDDVGRTAYLSGLHAEQTFDIVDKAGQPNFGTILRLDWTRSLINVLISLFWRNMIRRNNYFIQQRLFNHIAPKATFITVRSRLGWISGRIKFDRQPICLHDATARTVFLVLH